MKPIVVVLRKATVTKARNLGFLGEVNNEKVFLVLDFDTNTLECTDSKKIWSSGDYNQMSDEAFFALPVYASKGDMAIEISGEDFAFFTVKEVGDTHYVSTSGVDYAKESCIKLEQKDANNILSVLKSAGVH